MPSSRRPRGRARAGGKAQAPQCGALLADEATHCTSRAQDRAKYCNTHGREYGQLTGAYKDASMRVDMLTPETQRAKASVQSLGDVAAIDAAVALANRYLDTLGEEIDGRETHHKRFFQEVDQNHEKWLKRRRGEQEGAVRLLERLRKRREEVVEAEATVRKIEERRKAYEAEQRAAAEARRKATEEAQRKTIEEARRKAALEARSSATEDGWWSDGEDAWWSGGAGAGWKAAQPRSILGERTNVGTGTGSQGSATLNAVGDTVAGRVPPGYCPAVGPGSRLPPPRSPAPRPQPQPPQYPSVSQSTGERRPLLQSANTSRGYTPGTTVNSSWLVDVESQSRNAAQLRGHAHQTSRRVRDEESVDVDCGYVTTIFAIAFVFCNLVAAVFVWRGFGGKWVG